MHNLSSQISSQNSEGQTNFVSTLNSNTVCLVYPNGKVVIAPKENNAEPSNQLILL